MDDGWILGVVREGFFLDGWMDGSLLSIVLYVCDDICMDVLRIYIHTYI